MFYFYFPKMRNVGSTRRELSARQWWCTSLMPALGKQRQADLCELKASPVTGQPRLHKEILSQKAFIEKERELLKIKEVCEVIMGFLGLYQ